MQAAQAALDDFSACLEAVQNGSKKQSLTSLPYYQGSAMHALCQANEALGTVIDQLYAKMQEQAADPMKMGAVQGQYGQFNSADTIIGNLRYNDCLLYTSVPPFPGAAPPVSFIINPFPAGRKRFTNYLQV